MTLDILPHHIVDVIVPVYGIGPVFVDTVLSVFEQSAPGLDIRCVVVVDGCPFEETNASLLTDLAASQMFQLEIIHQKNAGVVAARNTAIDHILDHAQVSDFTLFLDGDDLLVPGYIKASIDAILNSKAPAGKTVGWAYASQFHFGDVTHWVQYPTQMWGARFAQNNFSQPSSLIRTEILQRGLRFDPQFNLGIEDWDFWCGAIREGYVGAYVTDSYVFYRRLIGSRSSFNRSNDGVTRFRMAKKHNLDSYDFIVEGDEMFPRFGVLQTTSGDANLADQLGIPATVRFGDPKAEDPTATIKNLFSRLMLQTRYRVNGVLDGHYTPQLVLMAATGDTTNLSHSHLFAIEHLFAQNKSLTLLELRLGAHGCVLVMATNRLYRGDGSLKPAPEVAVLRAPEFGNLDFLHPPAAIKGDLEDVFSAPIAAFWEQLEGLAPKFMSRVQKGFERNIVGTQLSVLSDFFNMSLGYLPLRHLPSEVTDRPRSAFVLPANGRGVSLETLETLVATHRANGAVPYLLLMHERSSSSASNSKNREIFSEYFDDHDILDLFDVLPFNAHAKEQYYNGTPMFNSKRNRINYLTGAMSYFSSVVNFGQTPLTSALASLKSSHPTANTYVANDWNDQTNEIEHLCAFLSTYSKVVPTNPNWRDVALGLGVRRVSLSNPNL